MCPQQLTLRKRYSCVIEKYIEDVKQDEKHVLDLLEPIMKVPGLVKGELRPILFEMNQFESKISKFRLPTFWIPEI